LTSATEKTSFSFSPEADAKKGKPPRANRKSKVYNLGFDPHLFFHVDSTRDFVELKGRRGVLG